MERRFLFIVLFLFSALSLRAQETVRFGRHEVVPEQNVQLKGATRMRGGAARQSSLALGVPVNGRVNVLMQFAAAPDAEVRAKLARHGVLLEGYVGGNAYYAQVAPGRVPQDFAACRATSVIPMRPEWKVSELLAEGKVPRWAARGEGRVEVRLGYFSNVDAAYVEAFLAELGDCRVVGRAERLGSLRVEMPLSRVHELAAAPWVRRVSPVEPPREVNNMRGAVLSSGNVLSQPFSLGGRGLTGKGVKVGLWDEDVQRHVDLGDRVHILEAEMGTPNSHGMHTAGTIAGAGVLKPAARGIAPEAELYTMNFNYGSNNKPEELEMVEAVEAYNISLSSNSYGVNFGNYCEDFSMLSYSFGSAFNIDLISNWHPTLTLIYSAGNAQKLCPGHAYGSSVSRSKNAIFVGAVDENGAMSNFSSWGPMDDGRLIPTVSAKGVHVYSMYANNGHGYMDGTSMACPTVTGHAALLTQRYHQLHGGQHPRSALMKGLLANTAEDRGNVGPDYQYGYGIVNAEAALQAMENQWYRVDTIKSGVAAAPFTIAIPAGVSQLRVMLTWVDPTTDKEYAFGDPALVNDLDLSVSVDGVKVEPWVLDRNNPQAPATRGMDALNNIEQVVIDNPMGREAIVTIGGHDKINDDHGGKGQEYVVTWYFDYARPELLHPLGGETFAPSDTILLRARGLRGPVEAEISYDDGKTYQYLGKVNELSATYLFIPSDVEPTGKARVRLSDAEGHVLENPHPFSIVPVPQNVDYNADVCGLNGWTLMWDAVRGVAGYEVLQADVRLLGQWQTIGEVTGSTYTIPKEKIVVGGRNVFAVRAKLADGTLGGRSRGVLIARATPLTLSKDDLPFLETFTTLPPPHATLQHGENISIWNTPTMKAFGFPVGSNIVVAEATNNRTSTTSNLTTLTLCGLDLRGVPAGSQLMFRGVVMPSAGTKIKLAVNGAAVDLTSGEKEFTKGMGFSTDLFWNLEAYAGKKDVTIVLSMESPAAGSLVGLVAYGLEFASEQPNVLVSMQPEAVAPKVKMGVEEVSFFLRNGSIKEVASVPVVVRVDGEVSASVEVVDLKPYEERFVKVPIDFSTGDPLGKLYEVEVEATLEGDVAPDNNVARGTVYNMGNIYAHPATASFYGFPDDPKVEVEVTDPMIYTDRGGALRDYEVQNIHYSSVHFVPSDPTKVVQIIFKEWDIDGGCALGVYEQELLEPFNYDDVLESYALTGTHAAGGTPLVARSTASDGGVYVLFIGKQRDFAKGWIAEVRQVSKDNYFTLREVRTNTEGDKAEVSVKLKSNIPVEQRLVGGEILVEGESNPVRFTIPVVAASSEETYTVAELDAPLPSRRAIAVTVRGADVDLSDNTGGAFVQNDTYPFGGFIGDATAIHLTRVGTGVDWVQFGPEDGRGLVTYRLEKKLPLYRDVSNLQVELSDDLSAARMPATLHVWIDANGDGKFDEAPAANEYFTQALTADQTRYNLLLNTTSALAGERRMRIALLPDGELALFWQGEQATWGQVVDITAEIKEGPNPAAHDLAVEWMSPVASGVAIGEKFLQAMIVNYGVEEAKDVEVTLEVLKNGESTPAQTLKGTVASVAAAGGWAMCDFAGQKVDLNGPATLYTLRVTLPSDGVLENNVLEQEVASLPAAVVGEKHGLDFKKIKGEGVDFSRVDMSGMGNESTLEGWFYLRETQFATLFSSRGVWVATTGFGSSDIPPNSILVMIAENGNQRILLTEANALKPGSFHHVAVVFKKASYSFENQADVYIDGAPVKIATQTGYTAYVPDFSEMVGFTELDGQVAMARFWSKSLTAAEVKDNKNRSVRAADGALPAECVAEFMFNEGRFGYFASGADLAKIESARIDSPDENVWVKLSQLISGITLKGQVDATRRADDGAFEVLMPPGFDLSAASSVEVEGLGLLWEGATVTTLAGTSVKKGNALDFSAAPHEVVLKGTCNVLGVEITESVTVRLKEDGSAEAKLLELGMLKSKNANLKKDVSQKVAGQTIVLSGVEDVSSTEQVELSKSVLTVTELSAGAHVEYKGQKANQGGTLEVDLTSPAKLIVVAENGRNRTVYTVQVRKGQRVESWEPTASSYQFTSQVFPLRAKSSSGLPVVFRAEDENVVTIDSEGNLHTAGVGETNIVATVPASGVYGAAEVQKRTVKVTPAPLTIRPEMEIEEGDAPVLSLNYKGLLFNEPPASFTATPEFDIYTASGEEWNKIMGPLPQGVYTVKPKNYTAPYPDGNYLVTVEEGTLTVKPSAANRRVSFVVTDAVSGSGLADVEVSIGETVLKSHGDGKVSIVLEPGAYHFTATLVGYTVVEGDVEVLDADQEVSVKLDKLEVTITYVAGANGTIGGAREQHLPKGATTSAVTAVPAAGYVFKAWDDDPSKPATRSDKAEEDKTFTASFEVKKCKIVYVVGAQGMLTGSAEQTGVYGQPGEEVSVTANAGYVFVGWSDGETKATRKDVLDGDKEIIALYERVYDLSLVENFNADNGVPRGWRVENYASNGSAQWEVGDGFGSSSPNTSGAELPCAYIKPEFSTQTNSALLTPWLNVSGYGEDLKVEFKVQGFYLASYLVQFTLEYRFDMESGWQELMLIPSASSAEKQTATLLQAQLSGKRAVQFRWVYETPKYTLGAAIDNIAIGKKDAFKVVYTAAAGGKVQQVGGAPAQTLTVTVPNTEVTAVADAGYDFAGWSDGYEKPVRQDGVSGSYGATFRQKPQQFTLSYAAGANGRIASGLYQKVFKNENGAPVAAEPADGYHFVRWSDGVTDNPRVDINVQGDIKVTAEFALDVFKLTYIAGANGKIEGQSSQEVARGGDGSEVKAVADAGYRFVRWSDGVTDNPRVDVNVQGDIKVTAEFAKDGTTPPIPPTPPTPPAQTATLTVVVKDADGPVAGATVTVGDKSQVTGGNGAAAYAALELGKYSYVVSKEGYEEAKGEVTLAAGGTTHTVMLTKKLKTPVESVVLSQVTLHPNPARTVLYVENVATVARLTVVSLSGATLVQVENAGAEERVRVPLAGLAEGIYLLVVESGDARRALRFVVRY